MKKVAYIFDKPESCATCPMMMTVSEIDYDYGCGCDDCYESGGAYEVNNDICKLLGSEPWPYDEKNEFISIDPSCPLVDIPEEE